MKSLYCSFLCLLYLLQINFNIKKRWRAWLQTRPEYYSWFVHQNVTKYYMNNYFQESAESVQDIFFLKLSLSINSCMWKYKSRMVVLMQLLSLHETLFFVVKTKDLCSKSRFTETTIFSTFETISTKEIQQNVWKFSLESRTKGFLWNVKLKEQ